MDFLKESLSSHSGNKPATNPNTNTTTNQPEHHNNNPTDHKTTPHKQPSTSELMSSAKVVADAAKATMGHKASEVDKAKVADAAGDLLCAAKQYGKLDEKSGLGKYVGQAEAYLEKYEASHSVGSGNSAGHGAEGKKKEEEHGGGGGSGAGDYFKLAQGFLKK